MSDFKIFSQRFSTDLLRSFGVGREVSKSIHAPGTAAHKQFAKESFIRLNQAFSYERNAGVPDDVIYYNIMLTLLKAFREEGLDEEDIRAGMLEMLPFVFATFMWSESGCPVFDITSDLFHSLAVTDFGESSDELIKLPFNSFVLRFPENNILKGVRSAFVHKHCMVVPDEKLSWSLIRFGLGNNIDNSANFTEFLADQPLKNLFKSDIDSSPIMGVAPADPNHKEMLGISTRILGNFLLYINANGGLPTRKIVGADVAIEREHNIEPRFRVGRPVKLDPKIREIVKRPFQGLWKLLTAHTVRGHWRMQAHGPRTSPHAYSPEGVCTTCGRGKTWIEPFWKGPQTLNQAFERTFEVA